MDSLATLAKKVNTMPIKLLIADDERLFRQSLKILLEDRQ
jgi:hypothetical protein